MLINATVGKRNYYGSKIIIKLIKEIGFENVFFLVSNLLFLNSLQLNGTCQIKAPKTRHVTKEPINPKTKEEGVNKPK